MVFIEQLRHEIRRLVRKRFAQILSWGRAEEVVREVFPLPILLLDGVDFPLPRPLLHSLFSLDGELNVLKILPPDQVRDVVTGCEAFQLPLAMLNNARRQIPSNANVKCAVPLAGKNVDRVDAPLFRHG